MFNTNEKEFYNHIRYNKTNFRKGLPEIGNVTQFWADLWENPVQHKSDGMWLAEEEDRNKVTTLDICEATRYTRNWAAPGPDFV